MSTYMVSSQLTDKQKEMIEELKSVGKLQWTDISRSKVITLKSLVNRGLVCVHGLNASGNYWSQTYWTLK